MGGCLPWRGWKYRRMDGQRGRGRVTIHNSGFHGSDETSGGRQSRIFHGRPSHMNARLNHMGKIPPVILMEFCGEAKACKGRRRFC